MTEARIKEIPVTQAQADNVKRLAEEHARGTGAMIAAADASRVQSATLDMGTGAATAYRLERDRLNKAVQDGQTLAPQDLADIRAKAAAAGVAADNFERMKIASQIRFDRQTAVLTPEDVAIAQQLKGIYGSDIPAALASSEAAAIRMNNAFKEINNLTSTFVSGFFTDLSHGVNTMTALSNATTRLSDSLIKMASDQLVAKALGGLFGMPMSIGSFGGTGGTLGGLYHSGGIVGADVVPGRYVSPAYFDDAPRFASGGVVGGEVPIIAHKGEGVFTPAQMAAMGGSGGFTFHAPITVNLPAGATKTDEAQAGLVADAIETRLRGTIRDELAQQMRQGGILKR